MGVVPLRVLAWYVDIDRSLIKIVPALATNATHTLPWRCSHLKSTFFLPELHLRATVGLDWAPATAKFAAFRPPSRAFAADRTFISELPDNHRQERLPLVDSQAYHVLFETFRLLALLLIVVPVRLFVMVSELKGLLRLHEGCSQAIL